jgi:hypothetical protein
MIFNLFIIPREHYYNFLTQGLRVCADFYVITNDHKPHGLKQEKFDTNSGEPTSETKV